MSGQQTINAGETTRPTTSNDDSDSAPGAARKPPANGSEVRNDEWLAV